MPDPGIILTVVDVQKINRAVLKMSERLIESDLGQGRKACVERIVMRSQVSEHVVCVVARLNPLPVVYRVAARAELLAL